MEQRFRFMAPSQAEQRVGLWGKPLMALILAVCVVLNPFGAVAFPAKLLVGAVVLAAFGLLFWRVGGTARRDEQARFGFVELTDKELRVSLSPNSLLRIAWSDFAGSEQKNGWLTLKFHDATITQADSLRRLDRIPLRELENPDALIDALRTQTPPQTNH